MQCSCGATNLTSDKTCWKCTQPLPRFDPHHVRQAAKWFVIISVLAIAAVFIYFFPASSKTQTQVASGEVAAVPSTQSARVLKAYAYACGQTENVDKLLSIIASADQTALVLMLLSGRCERIPAGTRLDIEEVNLFSSSRYRIYGTVRSLYVISPNFN